MTGLTDFGDPWFVQPLEGLIASINREGALESDDTRGVRVMVKCLADRLNLVDYVKRHPKVRDEKLAVPASSSPMAGAQHTDTAPPDRFAAAHHRPLVGADHAGPLRMKSPAIFPRAISSAVPGSTILIPTSRNSPTPPMDPMDADEEVC